MGLGFAALTDVQVGVGQAILMALLGGMGTFPGPVIGAFTVTDWPNFLAGRSVHGCSRSSAPPWWQACCIPAQGRRGNSAWLERWRDRHHHRA